MRGSGRSETGPYAGRARRRVESTRFDRKGPVRNRPLRRMRFRQRMWHEPKRPVRNRAVGGRGAAQG